MQKYIELCKIQDMETLHEDNLNKFKAFKDGMRAVVLNQNQLLNIQTKQLEKLALIIETTKKSMSALKNEKSELLKFNEEQHNKLQEKEYLIKD